jgi:copper chaperone
MKKFQTNIKCAACIEKVTPALDSLAGHNAWQVDLTDPKRVLTIADTIDDQHLKDALATLGYRAEKVL